MARQPQPYRIELQKRAEQEIFWSVIEFSTNKVIRRFNFEEDAYALSKKLNGGFGFAGFTPDFFFNHDKQEVW